MNIPIYTSALTALLGLATLSALGQQSANLAPTTALTFKVRKAANDVSSGYREMWTIGEMTRQTDINAYLEDFVDVIPTFEEGGDEAMHDFISKNLIIPHCPSCRQDTITVAFVTDTTGQVVSARVGNAAHPLLAGEAIRVVRKFPSMTIGYIGMEKVNVVRTVHIPFN